MYIKSFVSKLFIPRLHKTIEVTLFYNFSVKYAARIQVAGKSHPTVGSDANKALICILRFVIRVHFRMCLIVLWYVKRVKGVSFQRNCGAASVGVLQDNLVLSTELIM